MFNRVFLIVLDSLGVGEANDASLFNDKGANTLKSVINTKSEYKLDNLSKLGLLETIKVKSKNKKIGQTYILNEVSKGKDSLTGHYEMMGLYVKKPPKVFTKDGFPPKLIMKLEQKWGRGILGNKAATGIAIIDEFANEHISTKKPIVYTSADSVLQIAAHEDIISVEELYKMCEIARKLTTKRKWKVDRVIARPFIGNSKEGYTRTPNRSDFAISPFKKTYLDCLSEKGVEVLSIGKIKDIFNDNGISKSYKIKNNKEGIIKNIDLIKDRGFKKGLCFTNLVDFDSEFGHRRDPKGYLEALEEFDFYLKQIMDGLREDDLLLISADHGNDPSYRGNDHTREKTPLLVYHKNISPIKEVQEMQSFAIIGATIMENFDVDKKRYHIGESILKNIIGDGKNE